MLPLIDFSSNQALQPTADRRHNFHIDKFNLQIRGTARCRQRWLSFVSLGFVSCPFQKTLRGFRRSGMATGGDCLAAGKDGWSFPSIFSHLSSPVSGSRRPSATVRDICDHLVDPLRCHLHMERRSTEMAMGPIRRRRQKGLVNHNEIVRRAFALFSTASRTRCVSSASAKSG